MWTLEFTRFPNKLTVGTLIASWNSVAPALPEQFVFSGSVNLGDIPGRLAFISKAKAAFLSRNTKPALVTTTVATILEALNT